MYCVEFCRWCTAPRAFPLASLLPSARMPENSLLFLCFSLFDSLVLACSLRLSLVCSPSPSVSRLRVPVRAWALCPIQVDSSLHTVDVLAPLIKAIHASLSKSNLGHAASANVAFQVLVSHAIAKLRTKTAKHQHLPETQPQDWSMGVRIQCTTATMCKECVQAREFFASTTAREITIYGKGSTYQVALSPPRLARARMYIVCLIRPNVAQRGTRPCRGTSRCISPGK